MFKVLKINTTFYKYDLKQKSCFNALGLTSLFCGLAHNIINISFPLVLHSRPSLFKKLVLSLPEALFVCSLIMSSDLFFLGCKTSAKNMLAVYGECG